MAKKTITEVSGQIDSYKALTGENSINPTLDGGIKSDILGALNNKVVNVPVLLLAAVPGVTPPSATRLSDNLYFVVTTSPVTVLKTVSGAWVEETKTNDMAFKYKNATTKYFALSDDLTNIILVDEIETYIYDSQTQEAYNVDNIDSNANISTTTIYRLPDDAPYEQLNSSLFVIKRIVANDSYENPLMLEEATGVGVDGFQFKKFRKITGAGGQLIFGDWTLDNIIVSMQSQMGDIDTALTSINEIFGGI